MRRPQQLTDSEGTPIQLGQLIGQGGEGCIYDVDGDPSLVAKVYHKRPLTEEQYCKLEWMVARESASLRKIAAWPTAILRDRNGNEPCGLLMPKVDKYRQLHELYGTTNRRLHFPEVRWHHLLLAARNLSEAFHTLHEQGIVVGDVNQGNLMVDHNYSMRFIDCDSFQFIDGDKTYYCPVVTPHFTPPELQSKKLNGIPRTIDHDGFGLAVLIFHLVFVGRHPFAGRFRGEGDLLIETAIAERRFAFSRDQAATMVEPPPYSLQLDDLSTGLADLFEIAFRTGGLNGTLRPTPEQWIEQLDAMMSQRSACDLDDLHIYFRKLKTCPWCRIEEEGGPAFFVKEGGSTASVEGRLEMLNAKVNALRPITFPDLALSQITPPEKVALKETGQKKSVGLPDAAALLLALSAPLCCAGYASDVAFAAGSVLAVGAGAYLSLGKPGKARRQKLHDLDTQLDQAKSHMRQAGRAISGKHEHRKKQFGANMAELQKTVKGYYSDGAQLREVLREQSSAHQNHFLRTHLLRDHLDEIPGLTASMIAMLESYGVESALDVHELGISGVPVLSFELALELLQWRKLVEQRFVFQPEHGVTADDLERAQHTALQRFKISQARKILIGARHLDSIAEVGKSTLNRSIRDFDTLKSDWRTIARERGDFQRSRTPLERTCNRSPAVTIGIAIAIPIVAGLMRLILG